MSQNCCSVSNLLKFLLIVLLLVTLECRGKSIFKSTEISNEDTLDPLNDFNQPPEINVETKSYKASNQMSSDDQSESALVIDSQSRSKRYLTSGRKWNKTHLTWRLINKKLANLDIYQVRQIFTQAFNNWAQVSRLSFEEKNSTNADIQIAFEGWNSGAYVYIDVPKSENESCRPIFNEEINWSLSGKSGDSGVPLLSLALYMFGHALGLKDSAVKNSVMYSRYNYPLPLELKEDDINGIQSLYGLCDLPCNMKPMEIVTLQEKSVTTSEAITSSAVMHSTSATPSTVITTKMTSVAQTSSATDSQSTVATTATPTTLSMPSTDFGKTTFPTITTMATSATTRSLYNPLTKLEMFKKEANGDTKTILITPNGIEYNGEILNRGSDSIIFKRKPIVDAKTNLNSAGPPMIVCIFATCQF